MAYTADINIVVRGQAAVNKLQKDLIELGQKLDEITKRRIGPSTALETFNAQLREATQQLNKVAAGTADETTAIKNYVTALGNANAATERQNKLIKEEIDLREAATVGVRELADVQQYLFEKQRQLENSKLDEQAARVQAALDSQAAAAAESAAQIEKLNQRQADFTTRTDEAARAASRQTADFIRQQRIAKEVAKINASAPTAQLLLAPAAPGAPAMGGGARRAITGPVERLGGARTQDEAAMALRFAQALKEQIRPLSQIESLYAGISKAAQQTQRFRALPDTAMLNAASRGIQQLETAEDRYNRELGESAQRLQQLDRLEASRERRAAKLQQIADYYNRPGTMANAGFGVQGPAVPPGGISRSTRGGAAAGAGGLLNTAPGFENLALGAGFPLLFGGGAGEVAGGLLGSFVGTGFGGQILGSAIGQILEDSLRRVTELGNAAKTVDVPKLKESTIFVNQRLTTTLEQLKKAGELDKARSIIQQEVFKQTGLIPEFLTKSTDSVNLLNNVWQKFIGALSGSVSILGSAFIPLITAVVSGAAKILQYFNLIASSIGNFITKALDNVIKRSKFFQFIIKRILNDTTSETEDESAAQFEAAKQQIQRQQEIRDAFLSRIQTQKDASILLKKLNGEILTDGFKLLELDNELQKNNEEKYAVLRRIQDLRGAGGRAAGFGTEINQAEAKLAELENKKIQIQIQVKEESLRVFEQQIGAAAQRSVRTLDLQTNAIQGQNTVYQSQLGLLKAGNDLYLQRLSMEEDSLNKIFEQSSNLAQQLAILDRLAEIVNIRFRLNVQNAKIERASALANLAQGNALLKIELQKQVIQYKRLVAVMKEAQAQGLLNQAHLDAVDAQYDAVVLAEQSLNYGIENAKVQAQIADSMYDQRIEAAGYARNLELAQLASRRNQLFSGGNGQLTYGQGLGQVFQLGRTYEGSSFTAMATGGFVKKPTFALIGEGGQGEYVVPESKAAAFAMNYMLGARGPGAIDSNSAPPAINISTGPVMQQNGQNYVTIQDMEAGLQAVADTILNNSRSYSARRFAGVS